MNDKELYGLFEELSGQFDNEEPNDGHTNRFLQRLNNNNSVKPRGFSINKLIVPLSAVAATLLLFFTLNFLNAQSSQTTDLADVSAEMSKTQTFFTQALNESLEKLEGKRTPETKKIIDDALVQLNILEKDYKQLQKDLGISGDDERVIFAMITNFQNRIDLLQNVLSQINQITKIINDENNTI